MNINYMPIKFNKTSLKNRKIRYIVIHDTGNRGKGAGVDSHFKYFNGGDRQSSADFFVDDKKIGQFTDYKNEYSWHAGRIYGVPSVPGCKNANSVGIEICINPDSDYKKAIENTVELVKYLQKELSITSDRVIRHYDACLKMCPGSMSANNWQAWKEFKKSLQAETEPHPLKAKYGFNDMTIAYITAYPHSNDLVQALLSKKPLSDTTKKYIINYKYGQSILEKIYGGE